MRVFTNAAVGALAGAVAGAVWWVLEGALNWAAGGTVPTPVLLDIGGYDVAVGAVAGGAVGVLAGRAGGVALALGLAAAYAFLRVYDPPGFGTEALFVGMAVVATVLGTRLGGADRRGWLAFLHVTVLATAALAVTNLVLEEERGALGQLTVPLVFGGAPLAALLVDRLLGVLVRRRTVRAGLELAALAIAGILWGHPLSTAPLEDPLVTGVPPPPGTPDVILVSLDTTRADHLSTYGYARATSPHLTALAEDALRFAQARSPSAWTLPGHASLFTGQYPGRHGAHLAGAWLGGESIDGRRQVAFPLRREAVTLAELLRDRGYRTAAFVANFSYLYRDFGLAQGFQRYDDAPSILFRLRPHVVRFVQRFQPGFCLKPFRSAPAMNALALSWLDQQPGGRPAFLFLNYMEAHQPWLAPPPYDRWSRELAPAARRLATADLYTHAIRDFTDAEQAFIRANYDGQLAAMDAALGELLAALRARGRYENALVIVTADHGEFLGEHRQVGHIGRMLYEPVLGIPLVVKFPGPERLRGVSEVPVQLVDVLPTVLRASGVAVPAGVQGEPLPHVTHPSLAEEHINPFLVTRYGEVYNRGVRVVYDGSYKLISTSQGTEMLFDLARDPGETNDLRSREPERALALKQRLDAALGTTVATAGTRPPG